MKGRFLMLAVFSSLLAADVLAQGEDVRAVTHTRVCRQIVEDATYVATFTMVGETPLSVKLFVPSGETDGKEHDSLPCKRDPGAIETAYDCAVLTSSDSGYDVRYYSKGGASVEASVWGWTMAGRKTPQAETLPCHESER